MIEVFANSKKRNVNAKAIYYDKKKIVVLKGSKISLETSKFKMSLDAQKYRNDSKLVSKNGEVLDNIEFKSCSAAAQFVSGYSVNGVNYWKNDDNVKLKDLI